MVFNLTEDKPVNDVLIVNLAFSMRTSEFEVEFSDGQERSFDFLKCSTIKAEQMIISQLLKDGWRFHSATAVPYETMPVKYGPADTLYCTFLRKHIYFVR